MSNFRDILLSAFLRLSGKKRLFTMIFIINRKS